MALIEFGKVKVGDLLHFSAVKIQVKHLDHLFRIYIKALGQDTIYRVEEPKQPKVPLASIAQRLDRPARFQSYNVYANRNRGS
jgi:hypothetical protein